MSEKVLRSDLEKTLVKAIHLLTSARLKGLWGDDRCKLLKYADEIAGEVVQDVTPLGDAVEMVMVGKRKSRIWKDKKGGIRQTHSIHITNQWDTALSDLTQIRRQLVRAPRNKPSGRRLVVLGKFAIMKFDGMVLSGRDKTFCEDHRNTFAKLRIFVGQGDTAIRLGGQLA